jgi:flavin reductase (DIM6/NTAB) family NADH-FMN oxidoreductase RutF/rubredoxin
MNITAFLKMSYGIYLVSSKQGERISGFVANTVFQVTSFPPKIAISCHKDNSSANVIEESGVFSVSVLEKDTDAGLIGLFGYHSGNEDEKFERIDFKIGSTGSPVILTHAIAYFECQVEEKFDLGSHNLIIGKVIEAEMLHPEKDPLTYEYFRKELKMMAPERSPTFIDKNKLRKEPEKSVETKVKETGNVYICSVCGYIYDPLIGDEERGIPPGTSFEDLPDNWECPVCSAAKSLFISEN